MLQVRTENRFPFPPSNTDIPAAETSEDIIENAIGLLDKLNGFELARIKKLFDRKFDKVMQKDSNYILHDYVDNYFYVVTYPEGKTHLFTKGKDAYKEYS